MKNFIYSLIVLAILVVSFPVHAEVAENDRRVRYVASAGQASFDIDFPLQDSDFIRVYVDGVELPDTDYTVNMTSLLVTLDAPLQAGDIVTLEGRRSLVRVTDYPLRGGLRTSLLNADFDTVTQSLQEMRRDLDRALVFNRAEGPNVSNVLPLLDEGKVLIWGANGMINSDVDIEDLANVLTNAQAAQAAAENAQDGAELAETNAEAAQAGAVAAQVGAQAAQTAAETAANSANLAGTSTTSVTIGTGSKSFTTQTGKQFANNLLCIASASNSSNYMHGNATSYSAGSLVVNVTDTGGSGTFTDWVISICGTRGPQGATGPAGSPGAGTGDVVGPASVTDGRIALFDGTSGDLIKQAAGGYGSLASLNSINNANWSGTALSTANGGCGGTTAATCFTNIKQDATTSATGVVELATNAECTTGTDTTRACTPAGVAAALSGAAGVPTGTVSFFSGSTAPTGYILGYGQAISRTTYATYFALVGTTYGSGDGSTTFNVPDCRGRVLAGKDDMGGAAANRLTGVSGSVAGSTLGAAGGAETHTLTIAEMPAHNHDIQTNTSAGSGVKVSAAGGGTDQTDTDAIANKGGGAAHNNVQPTLILNCIIKI